MKISEYYKAIETQDKQLIKSKLHDKFRFKVLNSSNTYNKDKYIEMIGWDIATNGTVSFEILNSEDNSIKTKNTESNDFLRFIGIESITTEIDYTVDDNKIKEIHLSKIDPVIATVEERIAPILNWIRENYPDEVDAIYSNGLIYNQKSGSTWIKLMKKWKSAHQ